LRTGWVDLGMATGEHRAAMRFDGQIDFAILPCFQDAVPEHQANHPKAKAFQGTAGDHPLRVLNPPPRRCC